MGALLCGGPLVSLQGDEARAALKSARELLLADRLIPYLGPDLLTVEGAPPVPILPEEVAKELNRRTPVPARSRTNMWGAAQYIESRKHRRTLQAYMADIFAGEIVPSKFQTFIASLPLSLIVDTWYDSALGRAMRATQREDFVEIQGVTRSGEFYDIWTRAYNSSGVDMALKDTLEAGTILYCPHGGVLPAKNFLVADSDYVEVLTEIDIQSPIPETVKERRTTRGFLFLGCHFHDQMLRTYARQIMKRSDGPYFAVADPSMLTKNEAKFFAAQGITVLDISLKEACEILIGA